MTWHVLIDPEDGPFLTEDDPPFDEQDELIISTDDLTEAEEALCRQCDLWDFDDEGTDAQ